MEERVASLIGLIVFITANFKLTNSILCHGCSYEKIGSDEDFDPQCQTGSSTSLPVEEEECSEDSVVHSSDAGAGGFPVTLADVRFDNNNPSLALNKTHYGCQRAELSGKIGGEPAFMMGRSCTFVADKEIGSGSAGCRKGNEEELRRWIPHYDRGTVELDYFQICICFEDKCNRGSKLSGGGGVAWISVIWIIITMAHIL